MRTHFEFNWPHFESSYLEHTASMRNKILEENSESNKANYTRLNKLKHAGAMVTYTGTLTGAYVTYTTYYLDTGDVVTLVS